MIARIISGFLVLFFGGLLSTSDRLRADRESWNHVKDALLYALLRRPKERFLCSREHQD